MSYGQWKPYVPVAKRRAQAEKAMMKAKKAGQEMHPVRIEGRAIAKTFWGKAWCDNLEAYSDFENRLPRGRTYVRNGSVIDLQIEPGRVRAQVFGSSLYKIEIGITAVPSTHWQSLVKECTGSIASLVELLQGKLSEAVMARICQPQVGLFPAPTDIQLNCSCPDWATMCKHVAAVLYGVGARLDAQPELLFTLRQVDANDLVTQAAEASVKTGKTATRGKVLDDSQLADVFGIEMDIPADLPNTKKAEKSVGARRTKPVEPPAAVPKRATKKRSVATTTNKTMAATDSPPRKVHAPATEKPAAARKAAKPAIERPAVQKVAVKTPAQTKRKRAQT
ncbi:MAG: SWIM zinc finger family protein [Gammaproteobacteria bacterium]|nr:SWIM zinc finger family protein [Gammaproteobacteria bacterium]